MSRPQRPGRLAAFTGYLQQRWQAGCQNAVTLFREIAERGYSGSLNLVQRYVKPWRQACRTHCPRRSAEPASTRCVRWWLLGHFSLDDSDLKAHQMAVVERLCQLCPVVRTAQELAQRFVAMVKERRVDDLNVWLDDVRASQIAELEGFAFGLRQDWEAVVAALSTEVSNGQTEGPVNRLKMRKRQMYGRANFDLLRRRVLMPG